MRRLTSSNEEKMAAEDDGSVGVLNGKVKKSNSPILNWCRIASDNLGTFNSQ